MMGNVADVIPPMNKLMTTPRRLARRILSPLRAPKAHTLLDALPSFALPAAAIEVLPDPAAFRKTLLQHIAQATRRIVIVTLYLQDDEGGREVLDALYAAKAAHPA
jgi:CDP-diacylglycerol--serine O-phosphatidyltransferase